MGRGSIIMDLELNLHHLICGYLPLASALVLYYALTGPRQKLPLGHMLLSFAFCFYLVGVLTVTGVWFFGSLAPRFSFVPFVGMIRSPVESVLNIVLFVPLGIFLPIQYERFDSIGKAALVGFLLSLSIELLQMFDSGTTDVNDLIMNTLGACLGCCLVKPVAAILPKSRLKTVCMEGKQCVVELCLFCILSFVMMLGVQPRLYQLWFGVGRVGDLSVWR